MYDDLPMGNNGGGKGDKEGDESSKVKEEEGIDAAAEGPEHGDNDESTNASSEAKDMLVMRLDTNIARALGTQHPGNKQPWTIAVG